MFSQILRIFCSRYAVFNILPLLLLPYVPANAQTDIDSRIEVIALSDYANDKLLAAYPRGLYLIDAQARERIELPAAVDRITTAVTSTNSRLYIAAPGTGVWRSDDGGKSWLVRNNGLPNAAITTLVRHAKQPDTLYSYIPGEGIYRTEDAADSWQLMDGGPENMTGAFIHSDMPGSMQTGWLFAATKSGVSRSMDCFCLWRDAGKLDGNVYGLSYNPSQPAHIYAATDSGIFMSQNGGEDWEKENTPDAHITAVAFAGAGALYAGTASGRLYQSTDNAQSWKLVDES